MLRLIESDATGTSASVDATGAIEAVTGLLGRSWSAAEVQGPEWATAAITPSLLMQTGRDLIRRGQSLQIIKIGDMGEVKLITADSWHRESGTDDPSTWRVRVTSYGPSASVTRYLGPDGVVFLTWGTRAGSIYTGLSPLAWAGQTAKLQAELEKSLADEAAGPIAQLLPVPAGGSAVGDDDPLGDLLDDIKAARGRAVTVETTASGFGEGMASAPRKDWVSSRLGPDPPPSMSTNASAAFQSIVAACDAPAALFVNNADGTAQREAWRRYFLTTVKPISRLIETELTMKLGVPIKLTHDLYATDMQARAASFGKLVQGGMDVDRAPAVTGLLTAAE